MDNPALGAHTHKQQPKKEALCLKEETKAAKKLKNPKSPSFHPSSFSSRYRRSAAERIYFLRQQLLCRRVGAQELDGLFGCLFTIVIEGELVFVWQRWRVVGWVEEPCYIYVER